MISAENSIHFKARKFILFNKKSLVQEFLYFRKVYAQQQKIWRTETPHNFISYWNFKL